MDPAPPLIPDVTDPLSAPVRVVGMNGIFITFTTSIPLADLEAPFVEFANGLQEIDGLISKAWLQETDTKVGGFYLFTSEAAADAYLATPMVAGLQANPGFSDFEVRRFGVLAELSAMTGITAPAAA